MLRERDHVFRRRAAALGLMLGLAGGAPAAEGPALPRSARIGILSVDAIAEAGRQAFVEGLRELGHGEDVVLPPRSAEGQPSRLPTLAAEVVALKPDVIVTASLPAVQAARRASTSVAIVGVVGPDPAEAEALERLALRDKNLIGVTRVAPALAPRLMELLKDVAPEVARVATLRPATPSTMAIGERDLRATARGLRVRVQTVVARRAAELETTFDEMARERFHAVIVSEHPALLPHRARIAELATSRGLLWAAGPCESSPRPARSCPTGRERPTSTGARRPTRTGSSRARGLGTSQSSRPRGTSSSSIWGRRRSSTARSRYPS